MSLVVTSLSSKRRCGPGYGRRRLDMAAGRDSISAMDEIKRFVFAVVTPAIHRARQPLEVGAFPVHGEPVGVREAWRRPFQPFEVGQPWGPIWDTTWFR